MARKSKLNAGVIGLGIIGSRIAANLRKAGFQVYVWNRTPKPAPNFLASPAEVAGICDVVQIVVADSTALFSIIEAMNGVLSERHTVVCSATVGAKATIEAAQMVEARGAKFLDAPFTGSKAAAEEGALVYYIGGTDEAFRSAEPMLKAASKAIVQIGATGDAATVKIATNMLAAVTVQTLAEACAILKRSGVHPSMLSKALENHGVRSGLTDMKLPNIIAGDHETNFSVKHMFKDVQLAIQTANRYDIDIPATTATAGALYSGINQGWADMDYTAVAKFYEEKAGEPQPPAGEDAEQPAGAVETGESAPPLAQQAGENPLRAENTPQMEDAKPETPAATEPADISEPASDIPAGLQPEPAAENHLPAVEAPQQAESVEITPEPAIVTAAKPAKRPLPPIKPQKTTSSWFGSGRKR